MKISKGMFGENQYIDCMEGFQLIPSKSIDVCITDPPYGVKYKSNHFIKGKINSYNSFDGQKKNYGVDGNPNPELENDDKFFFDWIPELNRVLTDNAWVLVFSSHKVQHIWKLELEKYFTYKNTIIWIKNNWSMGDLEGNLADQYEVALVFVKGKPKLKGKRETNIVYADRIPPHTYDHQTPKPVECILKYLKTFQPDKVIDPFAGTCFVGSACEQLGIPWITFELPSFYEQYHSSIEQRIQEGIRKYKPKQKQKTLQSLFKSDFYEDL